jgi:hypothetical protein
VAACNRDAQLGQQTQQRRAVASRHAPECHPRCFVLHCVSFSTYVYTSYVRLLLTSLLLTLALGAAALAQGPSDAVVTKPTWGDDSTFEFGIYENGNRVATAYYRILKEKAMDRSVYRLKYVGRNPKVSEATECVVDAASLQPLRSTRKVVYDNKTFYQDTGYREGGVVLRKRYEGKDATERQIAANGSLFDYEELIWLIPQLDLADNASQAFNLFSMLSESASTVMVTASGYEDVTVGGKKYNARVYTFDVGVTPYKYWMVMQSGKGVPARIDMGSTRFENLKLESKKVTKFPAYGKAQPAAPKQQPRTFGKPKSSDVAPADNDQNNNDQGNGSDDVSPYLPPPPSNP